MNALKRKVIQENDTNVIYLNDYLSKNQSQTIFTNFIDNLLSNEVLEERIGDIVESKLIQLLASQQILKEDNNSNPFDSLFLQNLKADSINPNDLLNIQKFSNIKDKSDEIHFDDGWDD